MLANGARLVQKVQVIAPTAYKPSREEIVHWPNGEFSLEAWREYDINKLLSAMPSIEMKYADDQGAMKGFQMKQQLPHIHCMDGTKLSVQASEHHYCSPRVNKGPYTEVEVGFPSAPTPETWVPFAECYDEEKQRADIYAYIPITLVMMYIGAHGGIDYDKTFSKFDPGKLS